MIIEKTPKGYLGSFFIFPCIKLSHGEKTTCYLPSLLIGVLNFLQHKSRRFYTIIDAVSKELIETDIKTLAGFGTRHTLSDTLSQSRGIGAARRWIFNEFQSNC